MILIEIFRYVHDILNSDKLPLIVKSNFIVYVWDSL